jgi:hypothetical protein
MSAQDELVYKIQMNYIAIEAASKKIIDSTERLQRMLRDGLDVVEVQNWTQGHVSEDVTRLATLMGDSMAMEAALRIVKKYDVKEQ